MCTIRQWARPRCKVHSCVCVCGRLCCCIKTDIFPFRFWFKRFLMPRKTALHRDRTAHAKTIIILYTQNIIEIVLKILLLWFTTATIAAVLVYKIYNIITILLCTKYIILLLWHYAYTVNRLVVTAQAYWYIPPIIVPTYFACIAVGTYNMLCVVHGWVDVDELKSLVLSYSQQSYTCY